MSLNDQIVTVLISTGGALVGSACGGFLAFAASLRTQRLERLKLISAWTRSDELEKLRITAYRKLWRCLGGISTFNSGEQIVASLPEVQKRLQHWYYDDGGGLFLTGSADQHDSTKAAFFAARDLRCETTAEIWEVFHQLRRFIRRDVGLFASQTEEQEHVDSVKKKLGLNKRAAFEDWHFLLLVHVADWGSRPPSESYLYRKTPLPSEILGSDFASDFLCGF